MWGIVIKGNGTRALFAKYEVDAGGAGKFNTWKLCLWYNGRSGARVASDYELYLHALRCAGGCTVGGTECIQWSAHLPDTAQGPGCFAMSKLPSANRR